MSRDLRHDWNYIGAGSWKCWLCGQIRVSSDSPNRASLGGEICKAKQKRRNEKLQPLIRRLVERNN